MNTYWISLPCDLLSSLASFQCSLLHHLHLSSDLGLSKYVNQHSHLNLSRNVRLSVLYDLDFNILGHAPTTEPGIALRQWVLHQGVENHLDLLSWEEEEVKDNPTQQVFSLDEHGQGSYLRTNQTKQLCGLITYMKHIFSEYMSTGVRPDPFHPFSPEEWSNQTSIMMRTFLVQNLPTPIGPQPVTSGPIPSSNTLQQPLS